MMTRGISRAEAVRVLVEGYFEEVIQRLDDPALEELVRERIAREARGRRGRGARVRRRRALMAAVDDQPLVDVRADFPILAREIDGHRSSTSTRPPPRRSPSAVIEAMDRYYRESQRATSTAASTSWRARRPTRSRARASAIAAFVGWDTATTIFTRNATEAINLVAYAWGRDNVGARRRGARHRDGAPLEHRAVAAALRRRRARSCATCDVADDGTLSLDELDAVLAERHASKLVAVAHVSNVLGTINPVAEIAARARAAGARDAGRRLAGRAADAGRRARDRRRLLRLDRPQGARPDRHRRAARAPRAARGDAPVPRRRRT